MDFYEEMAGVASEVLAEFAQGSVLLVRTTTTPDEGAPWEPGQVSTQTFTLNAVVSGVPQKFIDGSLVVSSDLMVTAAVHAEVVPAMGDTITIDGGVAKAIKRIQAEPAAGTVCAYMIFIEG